MTLEDEGPHIASSPSLWDQLPEPSMGDWNVVGLGQDVPTTCQFEPEDQHQNETRPLTHSPANHFDPFDVGLPWTQGEQLPTQVQRDLWLQKLPVDSNSLDIALSSGDASENLDSSQSSSTSARSAPTRVENQVLDGSPPSLASGQITLPKSTLSSDAIIRPAIGRSTSLPSASRPDDGGITQSTQNLAQSLILAIGADVHEALRLSNKSSYVQGKTTIDLTTPTIAQTRTNSCVEQGWTRTKRTGLAPLLPQLNAEKRAGYWSQFIDESTGLPDVHTSPNVLNMRRARPTDGGLLETPMMTTSKRQETWAQKSLSDSRLLPNRLSQVLHDDTQDVFAHTPSRSSSRISSSIQSSIAKRRHHDQSSRSTVVTDGRVENLDCESREQVKSARRSRNGVGMGMARKTWASTWQANGSRMVRGRLVTSTRVQATENRSDKGGGTTPLRRPRPRAIGTSAVSDARRAVLASSRERS